MRKANVLAIVFVMSLLTSSGHLFGQQTLTIDTPVTLSADGKTLTFEGASNDHTVLLQLTDSALLNKS